MRMLYRTMLVALVLGIVSGRAVADEGEIFIDGALRPELAWLRHPLADVATPASQGNAFTFLPRLGLGVRYGVTNDCSVGLGLDAAFMTLVTSRGVVIGGTRGDLYNKGYVELALPVGVSWRPDFGLGIAPLVEIWAGPALVGWTGHVFADPTMLDAKGLPAELPAKIQDRFAAGVISRAQIGFDWRIADNFVLAVAPSIGITWAGSLGAHVGLLLRPSLVVGMR